MAKATTAKQVRIAKKLTKPKGKRPIKAANMKQKRLTNKQTQVKNLLGGGLTIEQVAKRMKLSNAAVSGHVRRIRLAGVALNVTQPSGEPAKRRPKATPGGGLLVVGENDNAAPGKTAMTMGAAIAGLAVVDDDEVEHLIRDKIAEGGNRLDEIDQRTDELEGEIEQLQNEHNELLPRQAQLNMALEQLA